jgi:cell division protein ZapE
MATSNPRPNEFLRRHHAGGGAHRRFLTDALAGRCDTVLVRGADRRRTGTDGRVSGGRGVIFVGPGEAAREALRDVHDDADAPKRWLSFDELRRASTETAHAHLLDQLLGTERLYVADVELAGTDDALRLLRLVDDLYTAEGAPALFFSAPAPPEDWFSAGTEQGLRAGIAEKFERTVSRLREMCAVRDAGTTEPA